MANLGVIQEISDQVLAVPTIKGTPDRYLIDRARRVMRHCGSIARLPDTQRFQVDQECLNIAALFRDAGFARYANQEDRAARMVLADLTDEDLRDFSAQIIQEKLQELINPRQMERVCSIVIESGNRSTTLIEAMILSDARNLDDMGAVGIFNEFRRYVVHGRGASDALVSWKRKIEYDYWSARLRESFRFDSVRELARRRLKTAEEFMESLERENKAGDLEEMLMEQQLAAPETGTTRTGPAQSRLPQINGRKYVKV
ncbi:MAG: hypothetical protein JW936_11060 [Sedimentisphaerales bacterium]|nr:hypothetical protein [Sedimentisphaerales bacterium]